MGEVGQNGTRYWRTLLSVVVAYMVAIQSLLIAVAGVSVPADAGQNAPAFELCLHDASGSAGTAGQQARPFPIAHTASSALPERMMR